MRYGDLTRSPNRRAREVLEFIGLPWEDGLLDIGTRKGTVATASSSQVREAIHERAKEQWRRYEKQLAPMKERLGSYGYSARS